MVENTETFLSEGLKYFSIPANPILYSIMHYDLIIIHSST